MTESDWLESRNPHEMLSFLRDRGELAERKARLLAVAVCRCIWPWLLDERSQKAVDIAEKYADGMASEEELAAASSAASQAAQEEFVKLFGEVDRDDVDLTLAADIAVAVTRMKGETVAEETVGDARDVVAVMEGPAGLAEDVGGEEWKVLAAEVEEARPEKQAAIVRDVFFNPFSSMPLLAPALLAWNDDCIPKLASSIYEERDFSQERLGVLADALEEVGADAVLIDHLRASGPHVRGCWVVDLLLARE